MNRAIINPLTQALLFVILSCVAATAQSPATAVPASVPAISGTIVTTSPTPSAWQPPLISLDSGNAIYVTGDVARPGSQPFASDAPLSVYAAILNAGGFTRYADIKKVYVLRLSRNGTKIKIPVNIEAIRHTRIPDIPLKKNDQIVVPEKFFSF